MNGMDTHVGNNNPPSYLLPLCPFPLPEIKYDVRKGCRSRLPGAWRGRFLHGHAAADIRRRGLSPIGHDDEGPHRPPRDRGKARRETRVQS